MDKSAVYGLGRGRTIKRKSLSLQKVKIMKNGDTVLISPDLTHLSSWIRGTIIDVENNSFIGVVISARTDDGDVFFGRQDMFKVQ